MQDPNIEDVMSTVGGGGARSGTNTGNMLFKLKPRDERDLSADEIIQELRPKLARVSGRQRLYAKSARDPGRRRRIPNRCINMCCSPPTWTNCSRTPPS